MKLSQANIQSLVESEYRHGTNQCTVCRQGATKLGVLTACDSGRHCKIQAKNVHLYNIVCNERKHRVVH